MDTLFPHSMFPHSMFPHSMFPHSMFPHSMFPHSPFLHSLLRRLFRRLPPHGSAHRPALLAAVLVGLLVPGAVMFSPGVPGVASAHAAATSAYLPPWEWPLSPEPGVARRFNPPPKPWLSGHRGVDLRASAGQTVTSPAAGVVSFVGKVVDRRVITIDHGGGLLSSFEPVDSPVAVGDRVAPGQLIGSLGFRDGAAAAHCPFTCLHWGVRLHGQYVDPLRYVQDRRPSVLLPVPPS